MEVMEKLLESWDRVTDRSRASLRRRIAGILATSTWSPGTEIQPQTALSRASSRGEVAALAEKSGQ
jgi:hypothetical protein